MSSINFPRLITALRACCFSRGPAPRELASLVAIFSDASGDSVSQSVSQTDLTRARSLFLAWLPSCLPDCVPARGRAAEFRQSACLTARLARFSITLKVLRFLYRRLEEYRIFGKLKHSLLLHLRPTRRRKWLVCLNACCCCCYFFLNTTSSRSESHTKTCLSVCGSGDGGIRA